MPLTSLTPLTLRLFCAAGAELGDSLLSTGLLESLTSLTPLMPRLFAWQTRHLATVCRGCLTPLTQLTPLTPRLFAWQTWHLVTLEGCLTPMTPLTPRLSRRTWVQILPRPNQDILYHVVDMSPLFVCFIHFTTNLGALLTPWGRSFVPPYVQRRCQQVSEGKRRHCILMYFGQIRSYFIPYVKET